MEDDGAPAGRGDPAARGARSPEDFRTFVQQRWMALVRFGYLLTGDWAAAEDLVQVALERTWRRWAHVRADRPEIYVKAAMANHMRSRWRRAGHEPVTVGITPDHQAPGGGYAADHSGQHALREALWTELRRLPPRMRAVVVLRVWEDLSEAETAALLRCSTGSVKSQMSRAMARLREQPGVLEAAGRPTAREVQ